LPAGEDRSPGRSVRLNSGAGADGSSARGQVRLVCEATSTTVTLSDPDATPAYAPGSRTGLLLYTGTGLVAGVADPAWAKVELSMPDGLGVTMSDVNKATRQFSSFTLTNPATTRLWAGRWDDGPDTRSLHDVLDAGAARAVLRELAAVASSSERLSVTQ
jgi:hypothetical protein